MDGHESTYFLTDAELELAVSRFAGIRPIRDTGEGESGEGESGAAGGSGGGESGGGGTGSGGEGSEGEGEGTGTGGEQTFSASYVKQLREEAAARRTRERELETKLKELEARDLSDKEKAERERDEARTNAEAATKRARTALAKAEVLTAATAANAADPQTVFELLETRLEFNDDDEPVDVAEKVKTLLESKPFLVKSADGGKPAGSGAGTGNGQSSRGSGLTIEKLKTMSPREIAALDQSEVDKVLAAKA